MRGIGRRHHREGPVFAVVEMIGGLYAIGREHPAARPEYDGSFTSVDEAKRHADREAEATHDCQALGCPEWTPFSR